MGYQLPLKEVLPQTPNYDIEATTYGFVLTSMKNQCVMIMLSGEISDMTASVNNLITDVVRNPTFPTIHHWTKAAILKSGDKMHFNISSDKDIDISIQTTRII